MPEQLFEDQITYVIGHAEDKVLFIDTDSLSIIEAIHHHLTTVETYFIMTNINQHGGFYGIQTAGNAMEGGDYHDQGFAELNNFVNGIIQHGTNVAYKRI